MADTQAFILERAPTPLGEGVLVSDRQGALRLFYWEDPSHRWKAALRQRYGDVALEERKNASGHAKALKNYFDGDIAAIDGMKVVFAGTSFQLRVWNALRRIAGGTTTSYGALARKIGKPDAVRAVGLANGQNPVSLVVPCHRVIGSDGSLTGYGGGLARKRWLLEHEARHAGAGQFQLESMA
jgi:methylated-DNA-[protein]-cysteine S-methyltransferase